ncbi:uncharacterized protein [Anabrus simplex]|uniref:uncharacterized protein isoform X2 n=1 Tax=Anabrus simplex TaxID=316456 RepID=UPI0035A37D20
MAVCGGCVINISGFALHYKNHLNDLVQLYLRHDLLSNSRVCGKCGRDVQLLVNNSRNRIAFACRRRVDGGGECGWYVSARKNTFFADSRLNLYEIGYFAVLWCILPKPLSPVVKLELGFSGRTIVEWCNFCREVCVAWVDANKKQIGGPGVVIEIDETEFGKSKYHKRRYTEGQKLIGGVERENHKNFFVVPVEKTDKETLLAVIKDWVLPGTVIISDCWKAYECLEHEGFVDLRVNQSIQFVDSDHGNRGKKSVLPDDSLVHTLNATNRWKNMKHGSNSIPGFGSTKVHFVGYLAEFLFKSSFPLETRVHEFFKAASVLYSPLH